VLAVLGSLILTYLSVDWVLGNAIGTRPALTAGVLLVIVGIQLISLGLVAELIVSLAHRANDRSAPPRAAEGPRRVRRDRY
jgi:dolichol-phosphate mannosyltransferase